MISEFKAAVFGLLAGLVACYLGLTVKGGPKGVGDAVNQTVVFSFLLLFFANSVITAFFLQEGRLTMAVRIRLAASRSSQRRALLPLKLAESERERTGGSGHGCSPR